MGRRFASALALLVGGSVIATASVAAQIRPPTPRDSARRAPSDSARPILPVVTVTGARVRAAPPPVAMIAADTTALVAVPAATAYDLVRRVTGLEVHEQGQGPGFTSNAVLRGFNSDHSADVLLTIDGVPINAPVHGHVEGFADWNLLVPAATQSLRVIHGGASPLYGDFALAGVVEVFTAADAEGTTSGLGSSSFGDLSAWMRTGTRGARGGLMLALDGRRQAGWQVNSDAALGNGLLRGWRAVGGGRLEGGVQWYGSRWDSPGFVSVARYNTRDLERAVDSTDGGDARRLITHARYARDLGRVFGRALSGEVTGWLQQARSDWYLTVPGDGQVLRQARERDDRQGTGGQAQLLLRLPRGQLIAGTSWRLESADYVRQTTLARVSSLTDHSYDATYQSRALFARWQHLLGARLALDLGGRVDQLEYDIADRLAATGARRKTTTVVSPKLGARYLTRWSPRDATVSLLGSLSHGFRGPVGVIADPTRAPFLAWSQEVGAVVEHVNVYLHAAFFRTDVRNERVFDATTLGVSSAGRSVRQGVDVRGRWQAPVGLAPAVSLFGAVTVNDARFRNDGTRANDDVEAVPQNTIHDHNIPIVPGDPVPGVARYTARFGIEAPLRVTAWRADDDHDVVMPGARLRATYRVLGPFTPIGEPGLETRAASVLDLGATIPLARWRTLAPLQLDVELQNVFNLRYVENRASGFITPGVPRVVRIGLRAGAVGSGHLDGASH